MRPILFASVTLLLVLPTLACQGGGEKFAELMGDTGERLEQGLQPEEFAALSPLTAIDTSGTLTADDIRLWEDHLQAFAATVIGPLALGAEPEAFNTLVNHYRLDLGQVYADLQTGATTPQDFLRRVSVIRTSVVQDLKTTVLTGEAKADFEEYWGQNEAFFTEIGYPGGPPAVALDAVETIGITPQQAAQLIEIGVKASIDFSRVVNPDGTALTASQIEAEENRDWDDARRLECNALGEQYWNQMMAVFSREQQTRAWAWWHGFERKTRNYERRHNSDMFSAPQNATE